MSNKEVIDKHIADAQRSRLWGCLQFDFQDGQLVLVRKQETFKPKGTSPTWPAQR
jgi:hypothetical protein